MSNEARTTGGNGPLGTFRRLVRSRATPVNNTSRREALVRKPLPMPRLEAVRLAPPIFDEEGNEAAGSTQPRAIPYKHPMVKAEPAINRIAHRELKIRVRSDGHADDVHAGKTVTWTMEPSFVRPARNGEAARDPEFRGDWRHAAAAHRDRFEAPTDFEALGFVRLGQQHASTVVDETGHTAIRVNLPPIAFNAVRVSAQLERENGATALLDLEVPGIIVIDPGHGGDSIESGSSANNATSHTSGILEKDLALDFGIRTRAALRERRSGQNRNLRIYMTRTEDINRPGSVRANTGRDHGADILLSIHFNGFNTVARGTETLVRQRDTNVNHEADVALARRVNNAVYQAILAHDEDARDRGVKDQQLAALSDPSLGNSAEYHPLRSALLEVEFVDNQAVDELLNIRPGHEQVRQDIADAIADALIEDLRSNP